MKIFSKKRLTLFVILFILAAIISALLIIGNKRIEVNRYSLSYESLPGAFDGYKIAQISDLHNTVFGKDNRKLLSKLESTEPDIIVITGDIIDRNKTDINKALDFVSQAVKIAPVYYVTGNHEGSSKDYPILERGLAALGAIILRNESTSLTKDGQTISIVGLDDQSFDKDGKDEYGKTLPKILEKLSGEESFSVLLAHRPHYFDSYAEAGYDLILSGHVHGGQIRIPFIGGLIAPDQGLFPKYDSGLYSKDGSNMIISRGLGNSIFPLRVNNSPEIILTILKSK